MFLVHECTPLFRHSYRNCVQGAGNMGHGTFGKGQRSLGWMLKELFVPTTRLSTNEITATTTFTMKLEVCQVVRLASISSEP